MPGPHVLFDSDEKSFAAKSVTVLNSSNILDYVTSNHLNMRAIKA